MIFNFFWGTLCAILAPTEAIGTEKHAIKIKLIMLTYPIEYGNVLTPQPETIYDKNPPMAVRQINTDDVPIASIKENPRSAVKIAIRNIPPPTPKSPDENPTNKPMIAVETKLNGILASSLSLLMLIILFTAINNNNRPKIISRTLEGNADATNPPKTPPTRPKIPSLMPGFRILSLVLVCL